MRKSVIELTLFQSIFITAWLISRTAPWFFAALGVLLLASIGMTLYLVIRWRRLPVADRWQGVVAAVGWLVVAWLLVRANGLTVVGLWG